MSSTKYSLFSLFVVFVLLFGCITLPDSKTETGEQTGITSPFTPSGCQYNNPSCKVDYECINNKCIKSSIISDLNSHKSILGSDMATLDSDIAEGSNIISYYNLDLSSLSQHSVGAGKEGYIDVYLKKGYVLQGSISVSGGLGNDVDFAIADYSGKTYIAKRRISGTTAITFTAPVDGTYRIYLGNTFSTFSSKTVTFNMLESKYYYFQQYVAWSKSYANNAELMTQHLTNYEDFITANDDDLKDAGYDTVSLKSSLSDDKTKLKQSVQAVNDNINAMESYFEQLAALQQQDQQATTQILSTLMQLLVGLG